MGRVSNAREKLIDSAVTLIGNRSYSSVGVQDLCNHAGVKKGSFYYFFESKKELTLRSLDAIWEQFNEHLLEPIAKQNGTFREKLNYLMDKSYNQQCTCKESVGCITGCPFGNLALEMSTQDEDIRNKIEQIFSEWAVWFEKLIRDAVDSGELPANTNVKATAQSLVAYIEGLSLMSKAFNDPDMVRNLSCVVNKITVFNDAMVE